MDPADEDTVRAALAQQGALLGRHESQLTSSNRVLEMMGSQIEDLTAQLLQLRTEQMSAHSTLLPVHRSPEPRANPPPHYDGDPSVCRAFLTQCSVVFSLQPATFSSEEAKVAYVITLLTGRAREWGTTVWQAKFPYCFNFNDFEKEMIKVFDRSVHGREAARLLVSLRQGDRSVSDYSIQFRTLAASCGWNAAAQWDQFLHGLRDEIQDEIAAQELPTEFDGLVDLAIRVDNRLTLRQRNRMARFAWKQGGSQDPLSPTSLDTFQESEPMQIGRTRLSAEERKRCITNRLCLYCGGSGHFASTCPVKGNARQ